nr:hemerythrin family protein [uncultured Lachnoclostridium sp.]
MFDFKFDWNDSLILGIQIIDDQHKELFRIGREIEQVLLIGCINLDKQYILNLLCKMRDYVTYHFYEEEKLIKELNIHLLRNHKNEHDKFIEWLNSIDCVKLVEFPQIYLKEIKEILQKWVFEHILIEDRKVFCVI